MKILLPVNDRRSYNHVSGQAEEMGLDFDFIRCRSIQEAWNLLEKKNFAGALVEIRLPLSLDSDTDTLRYRPLGVALGVICKLKQIPTVVVSPFDPVSKIFKADKEMARDFDLPIAAGFDWNGALEKLHHLIFSESKED